MLLSAPSPTPVLSACFPNKRAQLRTIPPASCPAVSNTCPPKSPHLFTRTAGQLRVNSLHPGPSGTGSSIEQHDFRSRRQLPHKRSSTASQHDSPGAGRLCRHKANCYRPNKSQGLSGQYSCRLELNGTKIGEVSAKEDGMLCTQLCFRGSPPQPVAPSAAPTKWLCTAQTPYLLYLHACSHLFHKLGGIFIKSKHRSYRLPSKHCPAAHTQTHVPRICFLPDCGPGQEAPIRPDLRCKAVILCRFFGYVVVQEVKCAL